jgi:hypothetical protein
MAKQPQDQASTAENHGDRSSSALPFLIGALFGGFTGAILGAVVGRHSDRVGTSLLRGFQRLRHKSAKDRPRFELLLQ